MRVTQLSGRTSSLRHLVLALVLLATACTNPDERSAEFCDKLGEVTGADGVESALVPGDPARIDGVVGELADLHERAPDDISATTRTLLNFFRSYQRSPRDERRDLIANNEVLIQQASTDLDSYALNECGLFLQRVAPTPRPTFDPSTEVEITD